MSGGKSSRNGSLRGQGCFGCGPCCLQVGHARGVHLLVVDSGCLVAEEGVWHDNTNGLRLWFGSADWYERQVNGV